ncbi:Asp/Glu/hydantoin racemase [Sphaerisporangium krabiense]|uniref:Maleate isomerase n=1 Tax=Sphaerisporangium krabiense TaxID=763782 RepID=A0A7W9DPZ8_9ACTN|nr:aspartate/glutamate racemase family protein [Sphaerisporangium krabiense]MBB5626888.1 maleate isomerase [Sphaerisporangium krabiense]GII66687.1 Asp/Glu/hydantoin racemase [Sphaerisporangium krabiense]
MRPTARRIGMITPSSNTVVEPVTGELLGARQDVSVHFTRLRVTSISLDPADTRQFGQDSFVEASRLLGDARVDVVAWNGTSGSWLGPDRDERLCRAMAQAAGTPATTSTLAILTALRTRAVRRLGLLTPYTPDVGAAIAANYAGQGFPVHAARHVGLTTNYDFALVTAAQLDDAFDGLAAAGCDAVAVVCTNVRAAHLAAGWESRTGVLVVDSVAATLWHALALAGDTAPITGYGGLLARPPAAFTQR